MPRPAALLAALTLAAACTQLPPDLDGAETAAARTAPYPALRPLESLLEPADAAAGAEPAPAVEARAAALRARAAALRRHGAG